MRWSGRKLGKRWSYRWCYGLRIGPALPRDARPVAGWEQQDEAWKDVSTGLRRLVEEIQQRQAERSTATADPNAEPDPQRYEVGRVSDTSREGNIGSSRDTVGSPPYARLARAESGGVAVAGDQINIDRASLNNSVSQGIRSAAEGLVWQHKAARKALLGRDSFGPDEVSRWAGKIEKAASEYEAEIRSLPLDERSFHREIASQIEGCVGRSRSCTHNDNQAEELLVPCLEAVGRLDQWLALPSQDESPWGGKVTLKRTGGAKGLGPEMEVEQTQVLRADRSDLFDLNSPAWVEMPGGAFAMGSNDPEARDNEGLHPVTLSPYRMSRFPVTNADYAVYVEKGKKRPPPHWEDGEIPAGKERHPVAGVSWADAEAFCVWLTVHFDRPKDEGTVRLPTEAQWEFAARGKGGRKYPWGGDDPSEARANFGIREGDTTIVGSYPDGAIPKTEIHDLAGNVWEWCADWSGPYPEDAETDPVGPGSGTSRALRGGSARRWCREL